MIEMLGVLAIIGVLSAGGIMGYSKAMENYKINQTIKDIKQIVANANSIFKNPHINKNTIRSRLCAIGVVSEPYCSGKSRFNTSISEFVLFEMTNCINWTGEIKAGRCSFVNMRMPIPYSACVAFLSTDWSNVSPAFGVVIVEVGFENPNSYVWLGSLNQTKRPFTVSEAQSRCKLSAGVENTYYTFEGRFYLDGKYK